MMKAGADALLGSGESASGSATSSTSLGRCVSVSSYLEAVGVMACHKAGVNPACLTPHVPAIRQMTPLPAATEVVESADSHGGEVAREDSSSEVEAHSQELRALVDA